MKFIKFERQIYDSLTTGQTSFLKPSKFGSEDGYKKPGQIQAYRGVRLWNAMFPRKTIPDFSNVNLLKLRKITPEDYKDHFPQEWHEAVEAYFDYQLPKIKGQDSEDGEKKVKTCLGDYGIDVIAIPKAAKPEHVRLNAAARDIVLTAEDLATLDQGFPPPTRKRSLAML